MTITFDGRAPHPRYAFIGMDGEHNAETLILEGLPEHEGKTVVLNIILPNGTADALAVTDGQVTITRNTTLPGTATAWVSILDGTDYVWKSEKILLRVGQLPDIDTPIEQQYPGIVEQAVKAIEEAGQLIGGVPAGGTTGQVLRKKSETDYDTEWQTAQGGGLPSGGEVGQVITKTADGAAWESIRKIPGIIGNAYMVLFDEWGTLTWEDPAYRLAFTDDNGDDILVMYDAGEMFNAYYAGRPIRIADTDNSQNEYDVKGLCLIDNDPDPASYRIAITRLNADGTWDDRQFLIAYDDNEGAYIGRETT